MHAVEHDECWCGHHLCPAITDTVLYQPGRSVTSYDPIHSPTDLTH